MRLSKLNIFELMVVIFNIIANHFFICTKLKIVPILNEKQVIKVSFDIPPRYYMDKKF